VKYGKKGNDLQANDLLSRSQKATPLHSTAQAVSGRSLTIFLETLSKGLKGFHRSVLDRSNFHSSFSTIGIAFSVEQQTGIPSFSGEHIRPQSSLVAIAAENIS
jgi:hypothetical protein